jgi:hypothetical protein
MRRFQIFAFVFAGTFALGATAQDSPIDVSDVEIAKYRAVADAACREGGKKNGGPETKVEGFCTCLMDHLTRAMTRAEWQQVYYYSRNQRENDEKQVLAPHLKTFQGCKQNP